MTTKGLVYARSASGENLDRQAERGVEKLSSLGIEDIVVVLSKSHITGKKDLPDLTGYTHLYLRDIDRISRDIYVWAPFYKEALAAGVKVVFEDDSVRYNIPLWLIGHEVRKNATPKMIADLEAAMTMLCNQVEAK